MADTDIRCHRACVYSSCSVRLCVIIRVRRSCDTDCRPLLPETVWLHESGESGSQSVAPRQFRLNLISPRVLTGDHTQSCTDTCERWRMHVDARQRCASTCVRAWTMADRSTYRRRRRRRKSTQDTAYAKLYATYPCCQWAQLRCHGDGRLCTGALPGFYIGCYRSWVSKHFFAKKLTTFLAVVCKTLLYWIKQALRPNKASFSVKNPLNRRLGDMAPWSPSGYDPGNATQYAASVAIQRRSVCECCRSVSPPNDPSKNRPVSDHPTAALGHTSLETRISVNVAARIASPPTTCTWTTNDDLRLRWQRHAAVIGGS